jgi:hypothetical protein
MGDGMDLPLMPKATAVWLVENTALTFEQIGDFCGLHALEVQAIADGEVAVGIQPLDPIAGGQITQEELERCLANPKERLRLRTSELGGRKPMKGAKYTPVSKRQDRPNAIAWLLRQHPELGDSQICRLIGTTKTTITAVRDRTHWNTSKIHPQNPVLLGLCTAAELDKAVERARARAERAKKKAEKAQAATAKKPPVAAATEAVEAPATEEAPVPAAADEDIPAENLPAKDLPVKDPPEGGEAR